MAKTQVNIRASCLLIRQLSEIELQLGLSKTEAITMAIDRLYQAELSIDPAKAKPLNRLAGLPLSASSRPKSGT